jgi:hypothetical protein
MNRRLALVGIFVGLVFSSAGCKRETPEEAIAAKLLPLRPAATARIEALQKLAPIIQASPKLTTDSVAAPAGAIKFGEPETFEAVTAGLIYETNLADLKAFHNKDPQPMDKAGLFNACGSLLDGTGFTSDHKKPRVLENCASARYVVMVRTLGRVKPVVNEADKTFTPGMHEGEVHVFDLDTGKSLGGFRFSEKNSDLVKTRGISNPTEIDMDLSRQVQAAIEKGLTTFAGQVPG